MAFSHTTLAQARSALAARLQDSSMVHWISAELDLYLKEALQFWGQAAAYYKDRVTFNTISGTKFYDISTATNGAGDTPLQRSTTDRTLVNILQYHLRETVNDFSTSSVWIGTEMFTMEDLQIALQRRLNQFLFETGVIVTESSQVAASGNGRVDLSQDILDVARAAWIQLDSDGNDSNTSRLLRMDESTASKQSRQWSINSGIPKGYSIVTTNTLQLQLIPPPSDVGRLHLLTINSNADLDVTSGVTINLNNDLTQSVKWGALADLLGKDGQAKDDGRAAYAEKRFREGVELAKIYPTAMYGEINGKPTQLCSIDDLDTHSFRWQSQVGTPSLLAIAGTNLLTMRKVPDDIYSITLDVNRNAILPANDGEFIQIGREFYDGMIDYAFHLAMFKEGAAEVEQSMPQYERFMKLAAEYNAKLAASAQAFDVLMTREQEQYRDQPRAA